MNLKICVITDVLRASEILNCQNLSKKPIFITIYDEFYQTNDNYKLTIFYSCL